MNDILSILIQRLAQRRELLGMPFGALAARSGVPEPTVKRIMGGRLAQASFGNVAAIADALGLPLTAQPIDIDEFRERAARQRAEHIARLVQGNSALESQGVGAEQYRRLVERSVHELLAGPPRRLWAG